MKEPPVELQVAQAFFEDHRLKVKVMVRAKTAVKADKLAVEVAGLKEGEVVEKQIKQVSAEIGREFLRADQSAAVVFALRSPELTEYQVRCSWGEEGEILLSKRAPEMPQIQTARLIRRQSSEQRKPQSDKTSPQPGFRPSGGSLELNSVELQSSPIACPAPPCDLEYMCSAVLVNKSAVPVARVRLAAGIYWTAKGAATRLPQDREPLAPGEEIIDLGTRTLASGEAKQVRVKIEQPIPVVPGGRFMPHVRLLDFSEAAGAEAGR